MQTPTVLADHGLVASVDRLASDAGARVLSGGGTAADAAIAANAVLAVTTPHMCGLGGDLFALVHHGPAEPAALNASGRAGSGADPARLRAEGHDRMPFLGDVRTAPTPGCVDGWVALHERFGRLPLADVLAPAITLAEDGFPASPLLALALGVLDGVIGCEELTAISPAPGDPVRRPGPARLLRAIGAGGRAAFYEGEFGTALLEVGAGEYVASDLAEPMADWVAPLGLDVWGHRVWTMPPNSQGYVTLAAAWIAERAGLVEDPADGRWAHVLVEAVRLAGHDRLSRLHEHADGAALLDPGDLARRASRLDPDRAAVLGDRTGAGGTTYLCTADGDGMAVSLIQSNASGFGCHVAVPGTGVLLHNRGIGFSLVPGHPAEYGPGRRPPHTLSPALVTRADGSLRTVLGTMGGDSQPQVVLQLLARSLVSGQDPGGVIGGPRWVLHNPGGTTFDLWEDLDSHEVRLEAEAPSGWDAALTDRGHHTRRDPGTDRLGFGLAHLIEARPGGGWAGAADPRSEVGAAVGLS